MCLNQLAFLLPRPLGEGWGEGQRAMACYSSMYRLLALTPTLSIGGEGVKPPASDKVLIKNGLTAHTTDIVCY